MAPAPKRRWSYSLRTLFVVVTVLCCWLGWNLHLVREHNRVALSLLEANGTAHRHTNIVAAWDDADGEPFKLDARSRLPLAWRLLGALPVAEINLDGQEFTKFDCHYYSGLFPEANVSRSKAWPDDY
jgi:hypothetical protein